MNGPDTACIVSETVSDVATVQRGDTIMQETEVYLSSPPLSTNDVVHHSWKVKMLIRNNTATTLPKQKVQKNQAYHCIQLLTNGKFENVKTGDDRTHHQLQPVTPHQKRNYC